MSEKPKSGSLVDENGAMGVDVDVTLLDLFNLRWGDVDGTFIQIRQRGARARRSHVVKIKVTDELRKLLDQVKLNREGI